MIAPVKSPGPAQRAADHRRQLLGHGQEFEWFKELFVPKCKPHISQLEIDGARQKWSTVHHFLRDDDLVRHLLGDRVPSGNTKWVGVFGWEKTKYVAIDVDLRGDRPDFESRCWKVKKILARLGIRDECVLESPSPSGGRHYYFFLYQRVGLFHVRNVLSMAGLDHLPGQHEVFPTTENAIRLPFGHLPHQDLDPELWVRTTRDLMQGRIPRVNWKRCVARAEMIYSRIPPAWLYRAGRDPGSSQQSGSRLGKTKPTEPRSSRNVNRATSSATMGGRYHELLARGIRNTKEAEELIQLGIQAAGTRVEATKHIACHLIFARKMGEQDATEFLVEWVYRTGRDFSKDVAADLAGGTRSVEEQTRDIVAWYELLRRNNSSSKPAAPPQRFAPAELDKVASVSLRVEKRLRKLQALFGLNFLRLAKACGEYIGDHWEIRAATKEVLRTWKGCSGMRYKERLDAACEAGLISVVKNSWHNPRGRGRARTFGVHLSRVSEAEQTLSYNEAVDYLNDRIEKWNASPCDKQLVGAESDTEFRIVSLKGKHPDSPASEPETDSVSEGRESTNQRVPSPAKQDDGSNSQSKMRDGPEYQRSGSAQRPVLEDRRDRSDQRPDHSGLRHSTAGEEPAVVAAKTPGSTGNNHPHPDLEPQHPERPGTHLVSRSSERGRIANALQRLRDRAAEEGYDSDSFQRTLQLIEHIVSDPTCTPGERQLLLADPHDLDEHHQRRRTFLIAEQRSLHHQPNTRDPPSMIAS